MGKVGLAVGPSAIHRPSRDREESLRAYGVHESSSKTEGPDWPRWIIYCRQDNLYIYHTIYISYNTIQYTTRHSTHLALYIRIQCIDTPKLSYSLSTGVFDPKHFPPIPKLHHSSSTTRVLPRLTTFFMLPKASTSLILLDPLNNIHIRSMPHPQPPVGGRPHSRASK